ncbi:hypothetical protein AVEN_58309-1 [Araneus ventricosus]|uniref:Uncharacterized protein n=1 Tax=Araneus ventricosus TaxID=182803 RepID=A0A4Y2CRG8_ARAVE|nr:hypothetical protein AVEN_58309-1 [Araneus ventricosus]
MLIHHCAEFGPGPKQSIHMSSKLEFLEHEKEKAILKVENLSNLEEMILSDGIPSNSKSKTSCADSNLRPDARLPAHQSVCLD